jgi:hypothetical protein
MPTLPKGLRGIVRWSTGKSISLGREVEFAMMKDDKEEELETPKFVRKRNERRAQIRYRRIQEDENDLMLFARLVSKAYRERKGK